MAVTLDKSSRVAPSTTLPWYDIRDSQEQICKLPAHREGMIMNDLASLASALRVLAQRGHLPLQVDGSDMIAPVNHSACYLCR